MHIIHPLNAVVSTKIVDFRIYKAPSSRYPRTRLLSCYTRLDPREGSGIKQKYIIELSELVGLSSTDEYLLIISNCRVLESTHWCIACCLHWPFPLQIDKIEDE